MLRVGFQVLIVFRFMNQVKEAFNLFDTEERGVIDIRELKAAFRALGFTVKKSEIRTMLQVGNCRAAPINVLLLKSGYGC